MMYWILKNGPLQTTAPSSLLFVVTMCCALTTSACGDSNVYHQNSRNSSTPANNTPYVPPYNSTANSTSTNSSTPWNSTTINATTPSNATTPGNNANPDPSQNQAPNQGPNFGPNAGPNAGPNGGSGAGLTGESCSGSTSCASGACLLDAEWPGGYCTGSACDTNGCPSERDSCVDVPGKGPLCLRTCSSIEDCRLEYTCDDIGGSVDTVCIPEGDTPSNNTGNAGNPNGSPDGSVCSTDSECQGGTCIPPDGGWPEGHCTKIGCTGDSDCSAPGGQSSTCLTDPNGGFELCVVNCSKNSDCRAGYLCEFQESRQGVCIPDQSESVTDYSAYSFYVSCEAVTNEELDVTFDIYQQTKSFILVGTTSSGDRIVPVAIRTQNNDEFTIYGDGANDYGEDVYDFDPNTVAVTIPSHPNKTAQLQPGAYQAKFYSTASEICWYVIQESTPGDKIDVNFHFVNARSLTSNTAPSDTNFQNLVAQLRAGLGTIGMDIRKLRYYDTPNNIASRYNMVTEAQTGQLVKEVGRLPGPFQDDALSLNVVVINAFESGGLLGISQGLPGAAGLHNSTLSGVIVSSEHILMDGEDILGNPINGGTYTGWTMIHEIGHYLGLFHTTEAADNITDPLADTPTCNSQQVNTSPQTCPDSGNIMFPLSLGQSGTFSSNQSSILTFNVLTK